MDQLIFAILALGAMLISLSTHEYSHALVGYLLGDSTAQRMGRLTLDPRAHIDPIGTLLIPFLGVLTGFPLIGWAKPVPFNPYNLKYRKWGPVMVALAGPVSNFTLAIVYLLLLRLALTVFALPLTNLLVLFLFVLAVINVVLGVFNFIPVPPLDGSKLLHALLDHPKYADLRMTIETRGPMILLFIIILDFMSPRSFFGGIFTTVLHAVFSLAGMEGLLGLMG